MNEPSDDETMIIAGPSTVGSPAAAGASNDSQDDSPPPPYLKLLIDCWELILDFLSVEDIFTLGRTCKRMNQLAGYYLQEFLPDLVYRLENGKVKHNYLSINPIFYQFIDKLGILNQMNVILDAKKFSSLKTIILQDIELSPLHVECLLRVLSNIEHIHMRNCFIHDSTYAQLADQTQKVKHLIVDQCYTLDGGVCQTIFSRHYPALVHFKFLDNLEDVDRPIGELLKTFLEKHPHLKHFECGNHFLWTNREVLMQANIQLDLLTIHFEQLHGLDRFGAFLRKLHKRDFYKTLHLSFGDVNVSADIQNCSAIFTLPSMKQLSINANLSPYLANLTKLRELHLKRMNSLNHGWANEEHMARSLTNLSVLSIDDAIFDDILPFIRYSKHLHTIRILHRFLSEEVLDLCALNEVRKHLPDSCRLTIVAHQNIYLPTVWKSRNSNLSHIKIRRATMSGFHYSNQDVLNLLLHRFIDRTRRAEPGV